MSYDPQVAIDAVFAEFGQPIVLSPDLSPVTVTGIVSAPDEVEFVRETRPRSRAMRIEIRAADATSLAAGSILSVAGERRIVARAPDYRDPSRLVASVDTAPEG